MELPREVAPAAVRVRIAPGTGVVVRFGPTIGVFAAETSPDEQFTAAWLQRLDRWERTGAPGAEDMAWEAAELLVAHRRTAPAWGAAIRIPDGYLILLHGRVRAQVDTASGRTELSGTQDLTWVDRRITGQVSRVALSLSESGDIVADPRSDLRGGLVPTGSGLVLTADPAPVEPTGPQPTVAPPTPTGGSTSVAPPPPRAPIAVGPPPAAVPAVFTGSQETLALIVTAGVLVADDGSRTILDRDYVFGRDPSQDPAVVSGRATPIRVHDPDNLISRVQARVAGSVSTATVCDANSANGTYIAAPGAAEWTRIGTVPTLLPVGWSLRLGARVFTHRPADTSSAESGTIV